MVERVLVEQVLAELFVTLNIGPEGTITRSQFEQLQNMFNEEIENLWPLF